LKKEGVQVFCRPKVNEMTAGNATSYRKKKKKKKITVLKRKKKNDILYTPKERDCLPRGELGRKT